MLQLIQSRYIRSTDYFYTILDKREIFRNKAPYCIHVLAELSIFPIHCPVFIIPTTSSEILTQLGLLAIFLNSIFSFFSFQDNYLKTLYQF